MQERVKSLVESGLVKAKRDPKGSPLTLYEYAPEAMAEKAWSEELRMCRGLVLDDEGKIIARPFSKFYNLGEKPETCVENLPNEIPMASEKLDGSLLIIFFDPYKGDWRAVTRGAWESPQAKWAQKRLDDQLMTSYGSVTFCCELIAPWNRVVVPYTKEEMVLLAAFHNESGEEMSPWALPASWVGADRCVEYREMTIEEAQNRFDPKRLDEGWVFRYSNGLRVKLKYDEYVRLHRIITGFSARRILESLALGKDPLETTAGLHDDFLKWYEKEVAKLKADHADHVSQVEIYWKAFPPQSERKATALMWKKDVPSELLPLLFRRLDGGDWKLQAWKLVEAQSNQQWFKGDQS